MSKKCRSPLTKLGLVTNQAAGAAWIGAVDGASHCLNCRSFRCGSDSREGYFEATLRLRLIFGATGLLPELRGYLL